MQVNPLDPFKCLADFRGHCYLTDCLKPDFKISKKKEKILEDKGKQQTRKNRKMDFLFSSKITTIDLRSPIFSIDLHIDL